MISRERLSYYGLWLSILILATYLILDGVSRSGRELASFKTSRALAYYQLLKDVTETLQQQDIGYQVAFGTLLGAVRHQGFIPWDDDLDLMVDEAHMADILSLKPKFERLGYTLRPTYFGFKIYSGALFYFFKLKLCYKLVALDIFLMESHSGVYQMLAPKARINWPSSYYRLPELYPSLSYQFGQLHVQGPNQPKPFLARAYGADWAQVGQKDGHFGNHLKSPINETLHTQALKPALPFGPLQDRVLSVIGHTD